MNIQRLLNNRKIRIGLSLVLTVAVVLGLMIPGGGINTVKPEGPQITKTVHAYDSLTLGEREQINDSGDQQEDDSDKGGLSKDEKVESKDSDKEQQESEDGSQNKETEKTDSEDQGTGDGDEGNEDGTTGEEGDEFIEQNLGMIMTWYKYGRQAKTIVCAPSTTAKGSINTAQLKDN